MAHPLEVVDAEGPAPHHAADARYVEAVRRAGGWPVLLPVMAAEQATDLVQRVDGVLLTGGADVDPARYGQSRLPQTGAPDPERDAVDLAACQAALELGRPMLAVCRGLQVLNVATGGTLVQHVDGHYDAERQFEAVHDVTVEPGSVLDDWLGGRGRPAHLGVNSLHHQVVDQPGDGVVVVSRAPDGVAEAIGLRGCPQFLGVQWHPELLVDRPEHLALFRRLVVQAGSEAQS